MTEWSDAELSRRLALAIGWKEEQMEESADGNGVLLTGSGCSWKDFDYRDPAVIWSIAERFECFPEKLPPKYETWTAWLYTDSTGGVEVCADTAAKAVAIAVIKAKEQTCDNAS